MPRPDVPDVPYIPVLTSLCSDKAGCSGSTLLRMEKAAVTRTDDQMLGSLCSDKAEQAETYGHSGSNSARRTLKAR